MEDMKSRFRNLYILNRTNKQKSSLMKPKNTEGKEKIKSKEKKRLPITTD